MHSEYCTYFTKSATEKQNEHRTDNAESINLKLCRWEKLPEEPEWLLRLSLLSAVLGYPMEDFCRRQPGSLIEPTRDSQYP